MLRVLITSGLLLMTAGFGAAGWQYWQASSAAGTAPDAVDVVAEGGQSWLISETGGIVPREETLAYLAQDRFVPGRFVAMVRTAPLTALVAEGEALPDPAYLEVFADIRAPKLAEGLCPVLLDTIASDCAVHSARVVPGSVDPVMGTGQFRIDLVYRLKPDAELPDLAQHVLVPQPVPLAVEVGSPATASAEAGLTALVEAAAAACAAEGAGQVCRVLNLSVDWAPARLVAEARIGWLAPLPEGVIPAPPLGPAPAN